jgi:hypothetical protein
MGKHAVVGQDNYAHYLGMLHSAPVLMTSNMCIYLCTMHHAAAVCCHTDSVQAYSNACSHQCSRDCARAQLSWARHIQTEASQLSCQLPPCSTHDRQVALQTFKATHVATVQPRHKKQP